MRKVIFPLILILTLFISMNLNASGIFQENKSGVSTYFSSAQIEKIHLNAISFGFFNKGLLDVYTQVTQASSRHRSSMSLSFGSSIYLRNTSPFITVLDVSYSNNNSCNYINPGIGLAIKFIDTDYLTIIPQINTTYSLPVTKNSGGNFLNISSNLNIGFKISKKVLFSINPFFATSEVTHPATGISLGLTFYEKKDHQQNSIGN